MFHKRCVIMKKIIIHIGVKYFGICIMYKKKVYYHQHKKLKLKKVVVLMKNLLIMLEVNFVKNLLLFRIVIMKFIKI